MEVMEIMKPFRVVEIGNWEEGEVQIIRPRIMSEAAIDELAEWLSQIVAKMRRHSALEAKSR